MNLDGVYGKQPGVLLSVGNKSEKPLASGATFTGEGERNFFPDVMVSCKTDQPGTLYFDFSNDGTNWDTFPTNGVKIAANIHEFHTAVKGPRHCRVRLVNDTDGDQTYLRLYTYFGEFRQPNAPVNQAAAVDADSTVTRPTKFEYEVAEGLRSGYTTWNKWGYNTPISTTEETLWSVGGLFSRVTTAQTVGIASSSANDTSGGTGAQSIIIYGVDENWNDATEVVTMNGTSTVTTTTLWYGINRMSIYLAGSGGTNAGNITATATTATTTQAQIPTGKGSTQHAFLFIPQNKVALLDWLTINCVKVSGGGSPVVTTRGIVTSLVSGAQYEVFTDYTETNQGDLLHQYKPSQPFVVGEKSLFELRAVASAGSVGVNARFSGVTAQQR